MDFYCELLLLNMRSTILKFSLPEAVFPAQFTGIIFGFINVNLNTMEVTAVVLYSGSLATYEVEMDPGGKWVAHLSDYRGNSYERPPERLTLQKEGRHWVSMDGDRMLADEIGYAVETKVKPLLEMRRRDGSHPAG